MELRTLIKNDHHRIGIIGGVGPYAGLLLTRKILDANTDARKDQDYPELVLYNASAIPDRTEYLLDPIAEKNPQSALQEAVAVLHRAGCTIVGIPCNTAHSPDILAMIRPKLDAYGMQFVHMIDQTMQYIRQYDAAIQTLGLLATKGTYLSDVYRSFAKNHGITILYPETKEQKALVHSTIYSPEYGIKTFSNPIQSQAIELLQREFDALVSRGAQAIILGCTELSLVQDSLKTTVPYFDPLTILAQNLVALSR